MTAGRPGSTLLTLTRIGFASKGVVYLLIGLLALKTAMREGGETTDKEGAIQHIATGPFGEVALGIVGVGLLAYAAWRFLSALLDVENAGDRPVGIAKRVGYFLSGALYASAGWFALKLLMGNGGSQGNGAASWTAKLMDLPGGMLLVAVVGVAVIITGIVQIRDGWREKFRKHLQSGAMRGEPKRWAIRAGVWGYIARGIVFVTMGVFVISAAIRHDPGGVRGLEGALDSLAGRPYGQWLLAFVAAGLACYGAYCFVEARYRRLSI